MSTIVLINPQQHEGVQPLFESLLLPAGVLAVVSAVDQDD